MLLLKIDYSKTVIRFTHKLKNKSIMNNQTYKYNTYLYLFT